MHNTAAGSDAEPNEMRSRPAEPTRREAEQLLSDDHVSTSALGRLLAAARSTGVRADTAGLQSVLADFSDRATLPATVPPAGRNRSLLQIAIARLVAAKMFVIVALAVLTTGGIALAATTGTFPNPLGDSPHVTVSASGTDDTITTATGSLGVGAPSVSHAQPNSPPTNDGPTVASASPSSTGTAGPSPSLAGLCRSWLVRPHDSGKADDGSAFNALIAAAGSADAVDGYCAALLASPSSAAPSSSVTTTAATCGKKTHSNGTVTGKCS
jgi:hypothetical protein